MNDDQAWREGIISKSEALRMEQELYLEVEGLLEKNCYLQTEINKLREQIERMRRYVDADIRKLCEQAAAQTAIRDELISSYKQKEAIILAELDKYKAEVAKYKDFYDASQETLAKTQVAPGVATGWRMNEQKPCPCRYSCPVRVDYHTGFVTVVRSTAYDCVVRDVVEAAREWQAKRQQWLVDHFPCTIEEYAEAERSYGQAGEALSDAIARLEKEKGAGE